MTMPITKLTARAENEHLYLRRELQELKKRERRELQKEPSVPPKKTGFLKRSETS